MAFLPRLQRRPSRLGGPVEALCKLLAVLDFRKVQVRAFQHLQITLHRVRLLQHLSFFTKVERRPPRRTIPVRHLGLQYKREVECNSRGPLEYLKVRTLLQILRLKPALSIPAAQAVQGRLLLQIPFKS